MTTAIVARELTDVATLLPAGTSYAQALAETPIPLFSDFGDRQTRRRTDLMNRLLRDRAAAIIAAGPCVGCAAHHVPDIFAEYDHPLTRHIPGWGTASVSEWLWDTAADPFRTVAAGRSLEKIQGAWTTDVEVDAYGTTCATPGCCGAGSVDPTLLAEVGRELLAAAAFGVYREAWQEAFTPAEDELCADAAARGVDPAEDPQTLAGFAHLASLPAPGVPRDWARFGEGHDWEADGSEVQDVFELDDALLARIEIVVGTWLRRTIAPSD